MRAHVGFPVAVLLVLLVVSGSALAGGTNTVYTYGGSFSQRIPADSNDTRGWMLDAVVAVPDHVLICDVDVFLSIQHTAAFDLQLFLVGPSGDVVTLNESDPLEGYYEGADYIATTFDDEADTAITDAQPPFAGSFRPRESLAAFDGQDAYGPWRLVVSDAYYLNTGCLDLFTLMIAVSLPESPVAIPVPPACGLVLLGLALTARSIARPRLASSRDRGT